MKLRDDGCVLCGSTWGDFWAEVDGERRFFCCEICAVQLANLVVALHHELGPKEILRLAINGDRRGRTATVDHDGGISRFQFLFGAEGEVQRLRLDPGFTRGP